MGEWPKMDASNRPLFAYDRLLHEHCERRPHFAAGRFAKDFGDHGHALGWCLYELGCKGPGTHANCSMIRFNDGVAWPVSIGHPCIGCTEMLIFNTSAFDKIPVIDPTSPAWFPPTTTPYQGKPMGAIAALAVGTITGAAIGYAAGKGKSLPKDKE
jgi:hydrogenase small subunit